MQASTAILLVQTGTPSDASPAAVREYLTEFLMDPFVIQSQWTRWTLKKFILPVSAKRTAQRYARFFDKHGRVLTNTSKSLACKLEQTLNNTRVVSAMRYGEPSLVQALENITKDKTVSEILILPMFPQYSHTTTGSVIDTITRTLHGLNTDLPFKAMRTFYSSPDFIECMASQIDKHLDKKIEHLFLSYHSLPLSYVRKGDPYIDQCIQTTNLLKQKINFPIEKISHVYQSRMGWGKWQGPFLKNELNRLASQGIRKVAVAFPGFMMDCLETLGEMGDLAENWQKKGTDLQLIPCLNDSKNWISALNQIVNQASLPMASTGHSPMA